MGLRYQTFRIISMTIALTVVGLYLVSRFFFLSNIVEMERKLVANDVERAQNALTISVNRIGLLTTDWATWDEAFRFMAEGGQEFLDSNLTRETFIKQRLAFIGLFDLKGQLAGGRYFDADAAAFVAIPKDILALFTPGGGLLAEAASDTGHQGVIMVGGRPLLLAALPVLNSEHQGPARGTLVMGSWLDAATVQELAAATVLDLGVLPLDGPGLPVASTAEAIEILPPAEDAATCVGLGLVRDIFQQPAFWVSVTADRDFFVQGLGLIHSSLGLFALAGVVLFLVLLLFLEHRILRPLHHISALSGRIAKGESALRLHLPNNDELTSLALDLNVMLDRLDGAKRSLVASENRYRTLFLGIGAPTVLVGPDSCIELANPAFIRLAGVPREELEGLRHWTDFCPDMTAALSAGLTGRPEGAATALQTRFVRNNGEHRFVLLTLASLDGGTASIVSLVDNTPAKQAEQALAALTRDLEARVAARTEEAKTKALELETANQRLLELDRIKSAILSSVSHELRTPLTSIRGFTNIIERDLELLVGATSALDLGGHPRIRRIRNNLHIINEENQRLTELINDFLDLSKIESGKMEWRDSAVDALELAKRAERATAALFADGPVVLTVEVDPATPTLFADFDRMVQVSINLLANARKFTELGYVRLRIAPDAAGDWCMRVEDTGRGIAPDDLERIFDNFTQAATNSQEAEIGGTGLGLSICRTIVTHYGGRIWAESKPGQGSVFSVSIPRKQLFADPLIQPGDTG
ncbi:CHASE4 domain-containing protein [Desulfovibrio sp. TomC]|uniref:CHASE4 domain-containing protein n=1 Tax=Desulfovibrio sp. TomC TaxID=1562888 RepID=UPI000573F6B5|nr:CHASE4 domain-containing protein [Desulfovibrio sp. TomC]KHK04211.1 two-component hybrid sensor and regulator [Desulfovibrio sp. TomC]